MGSIPIRRTNFIMETVMKNVHVSYEYTMMNEMYNVMNGGTIRPDIVNNMWNIVAYNTARNLIWGALWTQGVGIPREVEDILQKVEDQIRSLTNARTDVTKEKLQPSDFEVLRNFIEKHKDKLELVP